MSNHPLVHRLWISYCRGTDRGEMMPATETLAAFFAASVMLALAPGPDNIFVLTQAATMGRNSGLAVTMGLSTGLLFHTSAVALGLAAVFAASAIAFSILKFCGAAYLLWLAWQAFRSSSGKKDITTDEARLGGWQLYRRGIIMNISNPKVSIFFLAFLPQFADPSRGSITLQILLLGGIFIIATILVFGSISILAAAIGEWLAKRPSVEKIMNRATGFIFAALAIKLALSQR